jgi:tRNA G18 (ribose-2'-O)-methylase SpoU
VPANLVPISSLGDPRISAYANVRERDLAGREGHFLVEGKIALRVLLERGRFPVRSLLLAENRVEAVRDVLEALPESVDAFVAPQKTMDTVVGFAIHRGILALAARVSVPTADELLEQLPAGGAVVLGLVGIVNHDNVGGIFRNAAAFGVDGVLLDTVTCDPLYRKAIRVSAGASLFVPYSRSSSPHTMLDGLLRAGFALRALSPGGTADVAELAVGDERLALLFGTEGHGLPPDVLARARTLRIPMAQGFDSLNVAVASGIALHAARTRSSPPRPQR